MIAAKCQNDEMPPVMLSRIEQCFNEDSTGTAASAEHRSGLGAKVTARGVLATLTA